MKRSLIISICLSLVSSSVLARPIGDRSLGTKVVKSDDTYRIQGGAIADHNLFHSFQEFSIPEGTRVLFESSPGIQNIFTRVTGNSVSRIEGILEANANFFLLNPNGIIFGANAQLNINGSFLATTAESLRFSDGTNFSSNVQPLLTVNVPVGLQFGDRAEAITNQSRELFNSQNKIALIGGDINLNGGTILAETIELGSVGKGSKISLVAENLDYSQVDNFKDISFIQGQNLEDLPSILIGSNITVTGKNILIADGKQITGAEKLVINSESLTITGSGTSPRPENPAFSGLVSATFNEQDGGNIFIDTRRLIISEGGIISSEVSGRFDLQTQAISFATGNGGNITIQADSLELSDRAAISSATQGLGNAGDISLQAQELIIKEAVISTEATGGGEGTAGNLEIQADSIQLEKGVISAATNFGDKGNIQIEADSLSLNNSKIITDAFLQATGGNITIEVGGLALINSEITARAIDGRGGNINITAQGIFQDINSVIDASSETNIDGEINIQTPETDPTSGLNKLPDVPIDAEEILGQNLCLLHDGKIAKGSSFIITGRGGLPPTSEDSLDNINNVVQWAQSQDGTVRVRQQAQGWVTTVDGNVWLIPYCSR